MKKHLFGYIIGLTLTLLCTTPAFAQRTSDKAILVGASQLVSAYSIPSGGLEIHVGQYILNSYWKAGISVLDWNQKVNDAKGTLKGLYFDHIHWKAHGGWMYRLCGTYERTVSLYGGGSIFLGANSYQMFKRLPDELLGGFPPVEFIYGIQPEIDLEIFLSQKVALTIGIQSPVTFGSSLKMDIWHLSGSLGVRVNL